MNGVVFYRLCEMKEGVEEKKKKERVVDLMKCH